MNRNRARWKNTNNVLRGQVPRATKYEIRNTRYEIRNTRYEIRNVERRTWIMPLDTSTLRPATPRPTTYDLRLTTYDLRLTTHDLRLTTYDSRPTTYDSRLATLQQPILENFVEHKFYGVVIGVSPLTVD